VFTSHKITLKDLDEMLDLWGVQDPSVRSDLTSEYRLLLSGAFIGLLIRNEAGEACSSIGGVFITEDFFDALCKSDTPWVNRQMSEWEGSGRQALLPADEVEKENNKGGLTLLFTTYSIWPAHLETSDAQYRGHLRRLSSSHFIDLLDGYNLKRIVAEPANQLYYDQLISMGFEERNGYENCTDISVRPPAILVAERQSALMGHDYALSILFDYHPPACQFSEGERGFLKLAINGMRDEEMADRLGVTVHAVKQRWASVYRKIERAYPGVLPSSTGMKRGLDKREPTLRFLRSHKEELRP